MSDDRLVMSALAVLAIAGYRGVFVAADDPQLVDDEIQIFNGESNTGVTIQFSGGLYCANDHTYDASGTLVHVTFSGLYRSLRSALERAIEICEAKKRAGLPS